MKSTFRNIEEFAKEVIRQEGAKQDFLPDTRNITLLDDNQSFEIKGQGVYTGNNHFHGQVAAKLQIPKQYYDRIGEVPGLRAANVNALLAVKPEKRLVRTLDGTARAFLSEKYKPIDNAFILEACLPAIQERKDYELVASALTPTKLFLQIVFNNLAVVLDDPKNKRKGDVLKWGITLSNSEVGAGAWDIASWLYWVWCDNGATRESIIRRHHLGSALTGDDDDQSILQSDTLQAESKALQLKVRDVLTHALTEAAFQKEVVKIRRTLDDKVERPETLVENVTKRYDGVLLQSDRELILANLVDEGNLNRYGLFNAITSLAKKDGIEADKAYEYEKLGGQIIELKPSEWEVLNEVAA